MSAPGTDVLEDPDVFALVIPTFNGTRFLKRCLDYLREAAYPGLVLLSDNSSGEHREFVSGCPDRYPELWLETRQYPEDIRFLDKLVDSLQGLAARCVMLCAHDDFIVASELARVVGMLEDDRSLAVARGRVAGFEVQRARGEAGGPQAAFFPHPMRAYLQADPVERVLEHMRRYTSTFYSVHRRESLIESCRVTEAATKNVIFFQYLSSCMAALQGRIACTDSLFYVRQGHADSWSGTLKRTRDYEHWPMLIASPHYSRYYLEFRNALAGEMRRRCPDASGDLPGAIDEAYTALVRRSLTGLEEENAGEVEFLNRLKDSGSRDHAVMGAIVEFAMRYPDTY